MGKQDFLKEFRTYFLFGSREWIVKCYIKCNMVLEEGSIIDIETTGLNPGPGDYYHPESHIVTLGIFNGGLIRIYQLAKPEYKRFQELCHRIAGKTPQPRYAYTAHFEQDFLGIPEGWQDLTRTEFLEESFDWGEPRFRRYRLVDVTRGPYESREDWDIDSSKVPETWEKWLQTHDWRCLAEISYHNYIDLLRERQLV